MTVTGGSRARLTVAVALIAVVALLEGCTAGQRQIRARFQLTPSDARVDEAAAMRLTGVAPGARITLSASTTDARGVPWSASAVFVADRRGTVDTTSAPTSGSYRGAQPLGLLWSMQPLRGNPEETFFAPPATVETVQLLAADGGHRIAAQTVRRYIVAPGVKEQSERVPTTGFYGSCSARPPARCCDGRSSRWEGPRVGSPPGHSQQSWPHTASRHRRWRTSARPGSRRSYNASRWSTSRMRWAG